MFCLYVCAHVTAWCPQSQKELESLELEHQWSWSSCECWEQNLCPWSHLPTLPRCMFVYLVSSGLKLTVVPLSNQTSRLSRQVPLTQSMLASWLLSVLLTPPPTLNLSSPWTSLPQLLIPIQPLHSGHYALLICLVLTQSHLLPSLFLLISPHPS